MRQGDILLARARSSTAEQAAHNRLVDGSNPSGPTLIAKNDWLRGPIEGLYSNPSGPTLIAKNDWLCGPIEGSYSNPSGPTINSFKKSIQEHKYADVGARLFWRGDMAGLTLPCPYGCVPGSERCCRAQCAGGQDVGGTARGGTARPLRAVILGETAVPLRARGLGRVTAVLARILGWDGAAVPDLPGG